MVVPVPSCIAAITPRSRYPRCRCPLPLVTVPTVMYPWLQFAGNVARRSLCVSPPSVIPALSNQISRVPVHIHCYRRPAAVAVSYSFPRTPHMQVHVVRMDISRHYIPITLGMTARRCCSTQSPHELTSCRPLILSSLQLS